MSDELPTTHDLLKYAAVAYDETQAHWAEFVDLSLCLRTEYALTPAQAERLRTLLAPYPELARTVALNDPSPVPDDSRMTADEALDHMELAIDGAKTCCRNGRRLLQALHGRTLTPSQTRRFRRLVRRYKR